MGVTFNSALSRSIRDVGVERVPRGVTLGVAPLFSGVEQPGSSGDPYSPGRGFKSLPRHFTILAGA